MHLLSHDDKLKTARELPSFSEEYSSSPEENSSIMHTNSEPKNILRRIFFGHFTEEYSFFMHTNRRIFFGKSSSKNILSLCIPRNVSCFVAISGMHNRSKKNILRSEGKRKFFEEYRIFFIFVCIKNMLYSSKIIWIFYILKNILRLFWRIFFAIRVVDCKMNYFEVQKM